MYTSLSLYIYIYIYIYVDIYTYTYTSLSLSIYIYIYIIDSVTQLTPTSVLCHGLGGDAGLRGPVASLPASWQYCY